MIWVGTEVGLVRFDPRSRTYARYEHDPKDSTSISDNSVWSICMDTSASTDVLWIGTSHGLNRLNPMTGKFQRYFEQDGFPSAFVYGILRDDAGRLWLGTNHGLTRFDDRKPDGKKFKNYDVSDGLPGNEFNRKAFCRLRNGEFLFGGTRGVTRFDPRQMRDNPYVPPVVLTAFRKFGNKVSFDRDIADVASIELKYAEDVISFEFAALNYTNAAKNQYAYMMAGFDKDWIQAGSRRYASYTHLDAGEYVFRVKASNNDGIWNDKGLSVNVSILPPFWATWWFRLISLAGVLAGVFTFYRRRVQGLEKERQTQQEFSRRLIESQESERKRVAGELHDGLGQYFLVILSRAKMMLRNRLPESMTPDVSEILTAATQGIEDVRNVAYNLTPYHLEQVGLEPSLEAMMKRALQPSNIRWTFSTDAAEEAFPQDTHIHIYRIVQECVNNVIKHAGASHVDVRLTTDQGAATISVRDDGKGFDQKGISEGNRSTEGFGLRGIAGRVKLLKGTLRVDSGHGKGTTVTVTIPGRVSYEAPPKERV
jgi:signal transduction histidine kinase